MLPKILCFLAIGFYGLEEMSVKSAKILTIFPIPCRSHYIPLELLLKKLALRGHEITVVSTYPQKKPLKNFRDIVMPPTPGLDELIQQLIDNSSDRLLFFKLLWQSRDKYSKHFEFVFDHPEMQQLNEEHFDLLIVEGINGIAFMGYAAHFKCPIVVFFSLEAMLQVASSIGNPLSQSFIPAPMWGDLLSFKDQMNFWQRLINIIALLLGHLLIEGLINVQQDHYSLRFPSPKYPTMANMIQNVSLVLTNSHFSNGNPRPLVPALVEVGGMQVKEIPDPLPAELRKWMDEATDGVIYMSMGSNVKSSRFPKEKLQAITRTFAKLKQRIVWKFENNSLPGLPKNILISKWLPQDDLLAHPNLKFFITHGGLGSIVEAKAHAVPIIGVPIYADQFPNVALTVREGWCIEMPLIDLTEETLTNAINEMLTNSSYKKTISRLSAQFHDRPNTPMATAIFWVEYVLRHRGAKHMQSKAIHLNFIQLYSLDILGFVGLIAVGIIFCTAKCAAKLVAKARLWKLKNE